MKEKFQRFLLVNSLVLIVFGFIAIAIEKQVEATNIMSVATLSLVGACYLKIK